ncbi:RICIN domain-containing protein [Streptomyces sp. NBC_01142]|uniref:RICIN domain-containing protein n=1 Tax=Streptomyces sp. NBC_01142 TaxID=2975865 RepID=UPI002255700C|nr:RICIN domain-containing protein [Streptomyces sp. NBC_01142]MCX4820996.1 RICIN domain-containing protein [Streptomyces sp. NBC_01142]
MLEVNRRSTEFHPLPEAGVAARKLPRAKPALLAAGLLVTAALCTTQAHAEASAAPAAGPYGPDTCVQGTVWREATPEDHVCVPYQTRTQTRAENERGPSLREGNSDTCVAGFVPRAAVPGDRVCVDPGVREQARKDNERAPINWAATRDRTDAGNYVPHPFAFPGNDYLIKSSDTRERDGLHVLVADVSNASTADGTGLVVWERVGGGHQEFDFRRKGNGLAFQNSFEIVARHSGKCLDVAAWSKDDGARVIQWPCHGGANQKWYLERRADNEWQVRSVHSDKCLDAHNPALTAPPQGTYLQQWTCVGGKNQAWRLLSVG